MKLSHIGIAVEDLEQSRRLYADALGMKVGEPEELPERKLRICMVDMGLDGPAIELLWPTAEDSAVAGFLKKRGPGIHHLCFDVPDVAEKLRQLKAAGVKLIDESPRPGAHHTLVAFAHPGSLGGVLIEFSQPAG